MKLLTEINNVNLRDIFQGDGQAPVLMGTQYGGLESLKLQAASGRKEAAIGVGKAPRRWQLTPIKNAPDHVNPKIGGIMTPKVVLLPWRGSGRRPYAPRTAF